MTYTIYLIILILIVCIILSICFSKYLFRDSKNNIKNIKHIESFSNDIPIKRENIEYNNLINNGNFENGKDSLNHTTQSGYNKIIMFKNPGLSSYVLEQKKTDTLTYYELVCENDKNSKYNLLFWLSIENNNINELNFEKLIQIKIQNEDFSNYIPRLNYNIIQKIILSESDQNIWYLIKYDFISSNTSKDKMQIYLNYDINLQYNKYYFTGISMYRVLIDAENFIYNNKLICYVDGYNYESNSPTFHDLSGKGNDLFWSNIPIADYTIGSLSMLNYKLIGFQTDKLSNNQFTIILCINKNFENSAELNAFEEEDDEFYLISMPGNERYSFEIKLKDNYIYLVNGNNVYKSKNEVIMYNKSLFAITYSKNILTILQDGIVIISEKINKIYFSPDNFLINRNKNLNYNLYSLLFYNRVIDKKELDDIRSYFITNQNKNFNKLDINKYHMNNNIEYALNNIDNNIYKPYSKKLNNNMPYDNIFIDNFDNQNYKIKENFSSNCSDECNSLCDSFKNNSDKYNQCISNCQNVLPSCQDYCTEEENNQSIYCSNNNTNNNNTSNNCPKVYKKNGKYMVYVPPNSEYSKNFSGERSYGKNLSKARYTYNLNFPNCPTPSELVQGSTNNNIETCPYVVNEANPCHMSVCSGVNWDVSDYQDLNLNKNCKKVVSNYCQLNYNIDDNCSCWSSSNKNNQQCIDFRRHFEDPNDYCSPNQFKIEEHPDFSKYIKKDNIPCWGCNLNM